MSDGIAEIAYTLSRLQGELEDLAVGGLRAAGTERLPVLEALRDDLEKAGGSSLSTRIAVLVTAIREGRREAGAALMRLQAALRLFERLLTLEVAATRLAVAAGAESGPKQAVGPDNGPSA